MNKNVLKSSISLILPLFFLFVITGCQEELEYERFDNENKSETLYLRSEGGNETFTIKSNTDWRLSIDDSSGSWLSIEGSTSGSGNKDVGINYEKNNGYNRQAVIYISMSGVNAVDTLYLNQFGKKVSIELGAEELSFPAIGGEFTLPVLTNLDESSKENITVTLLEGNTWIKSLEFSDDYTTLKGVVEGNSSFDSRVVGVEVSFPDGWGGKISSVCYLEQAQRGGTQDTKSVTFETLKEMISGSDGEITIESDISISGIIISDSGNPNVAANPNISQITIDYEENYKTAYIQNEDGSSGLSLKISSVNENILNRYDKVDLWLNSLVLRKETNPERYTLEGVSFDHVISKEAGSSTDVVVKEKYIEDLVDDDLYTFVTLLDCEFPIKKGSFTPINEGYGSAFNVYRVDMYPLLVVDSKGGVTHLMTNLDTDYRRNGSGVPKGSGSISGIIVHEDYKRFEEDGYIGRYQIRVLSREEIAVSENASENEFSLLAEWSKFQGTSKGVTPTFGNGLLWQTWTAGNMYQTVDFSSLGPIDTDGSNKGVTSGGIAKTVWWNNQEGQSWIIKFNTNGVKSDLVTLNLAVNNGHVGGPRFWVVETSNNGDVDGTWETVAEYSVPDVVQWGNTLYTQMPGWKNISFKLDPSILDGEEAYVRLRVTDNIAGTTNNYTGGQITGSAANVLYYVSIRYKN